MEKAPVNMMGKEEKERRSTHVNVTRRNPTQPLQSTGDTENLRRRLRPDDGGNVRGEESDAGFDVFEDLDGCERVEEKGGDKGKR